jgi:large subunit ribosomal protein L24
MERLKVGDLVEVISGKNKGKRGKVQRLLKDDDRVVVEGVNVVVRHTRPSQQHPDGGRISKEAAIHVSNVMPIDADSDKPTRVKVVVDEDGKKTRVAKSGADLKQG